MDNTLSKIQPKGIFDQKGGTFGMVVLAIIAVAVLFYIGPIVAYLRELATNLVGLALMAIAFAAIVYVVFDPKARKIIGTLYMMGIKALMGMVIKMNPIAILEDSIIRMYKSIENVEKNMAKLNGVRLKFKDKIKDKKKQLQECLDRKKVAETAGKRELAILEDRQAVRLRDLTQEYIDLQQSAENWYSTLSKLAEMAKITAQDAENEVAAQKERYEMVKTSHNAFKSAMSILKGNPDDLAIYNQAFQYVNDDIMEKVGEMDRVINTTGGMLDKMDLEKEIFAIKGNDISKKYEELGIDALFNKFDVLPSRQINDIMAPSEKLNVNVGGPTTSVQQKSKSKYF